MGIEERRDDDEIFLFIIYDLFFSSSLSFSQKISDGYSAFFLRKPTGEPMATLVNINNISMWAQGDGILGHNPYPYDSGVPTTAWGVFYPRGTAGVVNPDGIIWGGFVKDGHEPELRVGGTRWRTGMVPGRIITKGVAEDPDDPDTRIWRIRPDWQTVDLTRDAAEFFNTPIDSVTQEQMGAVRAQYEKDWKDWPWQKGAPFYDTNGNGIMDSGEEPGLAHADQVVWFVANDLDSAVTIFYYPEDCSPPIGIEMQVTLWVYNRSGSRLNDAFQNVIFKRVRLIYKGRADTPDTARIDSMFLAQFVDIDVGDLHDDCAGCDTLLQMGYGYNSRSSDFAFQKFNLFAPAIGYALIQGPIEESNNTVDNARFDFTTRKGFKNLPMTSFFYRCTGFFYIDPQSTSEMYNVMNGFLPIRIEPLMPFLDPNGNPIKFMVSGDPVKGTGFIDKGYGYGSTPPYPPWYEGCYFFGDRRFQMNSGPFTMALGDTQEVIIAIVGGIGSGNLASVSVMKHHFKWVRSWAQEVFVKGLEDVPPDELLAEEGELPQDFRLYQNYPNPFNAETEIRYDLPVQKNVRLTIYNLLGQVVKVLVNEKQDAKSYVIKWDGTDVRGEKVPTGIYLYRIDAGYWVLIKKMMLLE